MLELVGLAGFLGLYGFQGARLTHIEDYRAMQILGFRV